MLPLRVIILLIYITLQGNNGHIKLELDMAQAPKAKSDAYEAVFIALAHPARRHIIITLHFNGGCMQSGEVHRSFSHAWPTTVKHLKVLEKAGLIQRKKVGRTCVYTFVRDRLQLVTDWLALMSKPEGKHKHRSN
jgi:DNA-binding transcriptional ArsR family regulator